MAPPWLEEIFVHGDLGPLIFDRTKMGIIRRNRLAQTCKELYRLLLPSFQETGTAVKQFGREKVVCHAAALGQQTVVIEAHLELGCPMTWHSAKAAALFDNIEILAFIAKLHPVWVYETISHSARAGSAGCLDHALRLHDLMVREHSDKVDSVILVDSQTVKNAVKLAAMWDQDDALRVFYHFGFLMTKNVAWHAAHSNSIRALRAMLSMNVEKTLATTLAAAERHTHGALEWLKDNGWPFPLSCRLPCRAAESGSLKCLQYLEGQGCDFDESVTMKAAMTGQLDALMHLRDRNVPWDDRVVTAALCKGRLNILHFALPNGCPYNLAEANAAYTFSRPRASNPDVRDRMDRSMAFLTMFHSTHEEAAR